MFMVCGLLFVVAAALSEVFTNADRPDSSQPVCCDNSTDILASN
jgi:hypothetical protein